MAKKCAKKRNAHAKIVVLDIKCIAFLTFSLPSSLLDLKVPNFCHQNRKYQRGLCFKIF